MRGWQAHVPMIIATLAVAVSLLGVATKPNIGNIAVTVVVIAAWCGVLYLWEKRDE